MSLLETLAGGKPKPKTPLLAELVEAYPEEAEDWDDAVAPTVERGEEPAEQTAGPVAQQPPKQADEPETARRPERSSNKGDVECIHLVLLDLDDEELFARTGPEATPRIAPPAAPISDEPAPGRETLQSKSPSEAIVVTQPFLVAPAAPRRRTGVLLMGAGVIAGLAALALAGLVAWQHSQGERFNQLLNAKALVAPAPSEPDEVAREVARVVPPPGAPVRVPGPLESSESSAALVKQAIPSPKSKPSITSTPRSRIEIRAPAADMTAARLREAYELSQSGRYRDAERAYRAVLVDAPRNANALLALAVIAHRAGDVERARRLYGAVTELRPGEGTAELGIAELTAESSRAATIMLRERLEDSPQEPHPHAALGAAYAREGRWTEAQHHFFQAYVRADRNADLAFNLAVALDRLGKRDAARDYYREAIAWHSPLSSFDIDAASVRLATLSTPGGSVR